MFENIVLRVGRNVENIPDRPAIVDRSTDTFFTYRQLDLWARRIATKLVRMGVGRNDYVIIELPRTKEYIAAMIGTWIAGAAFVPLSPTFPEERLEYIRNDCGVRSIINEDFLRDIEMEEPAEGMPEPAPSDPSLLVYTSGSTGRPKGVLHSHASILHAVNRFHDVICAPGVVHTALGSLFTFVASVYGIFTPLCAGLTAYIMPREIMRDPELLADFIEENQINYLFISPRILKVFKARGSSLKVVETGSERVSRVHPADYKIAVCYGQTESTGPAMMFWLDREYENTPIGKPMADIAAYILDQEGCEAEEGELCLAGVFADGYLNLPEQTASVFTPNPFKDRDGHERLLHTGDIVRRGEGGNIIYLNRRDWMVKINGQRVEPGEIEMRLRDIDGIADAAVKEYTNEEGQMFLAAYYVAENPLDISSMKKALAKSLPEYMIPTAFVRLDRLPTNVNGKLDRAALPTPDIGRQDGDASRPDAENEIQGKIFACAARSIGHGEFDKTTDLFEAGLGSIGVIRLSSLLDKTFGLPVSIRDIRENPTVEALEAFLSSRTGQKDYELMEDYPLTQTQLGILTETNLHPDTTIYNIPLLFKLSDKLNIEKLKTSLEQAIAAHPYLNALIFADDQGNFRVRRNDNLAPEVRIIETDHLPDPLVTPFRIGGGKLYRSVIYVTKEGAWLFLDFHHIISDGTSTAVFIRDVNDAYAGREIEKESYTGYELALDEEALRKTKRYDQAKAWFGRLLEEADQEMLPDGDVWGKEEKAGAMRISSQVDLSRIRTWLKDRKISANAFFNAVFAFTLSRFTGKKDAFYTTVYNGRSDSRTNRTVTMMVKTFPVFCHVDGQETIRTFAESISRQLMTSMSHDLYSFAEIAGEHGIASDVLFAYQGTEFIHNRIGGEETEMVLLLQGEAKTPLNIALYEKEGRLLFDCEFRADLFSDEYVRRFVACFEKVAQEFIEKPVLGDVSLITEDTQREMDAFNQTATSYPVTDMVSLFRKAADRFPERTALVFKEKEFTYGQVDRISDRIAAFLSGNGVGRGDIVSILIPRCEYMVTASLGALKTGAAYQPLDPSYPTDRLTFMMKDADCRLLIADESLLAKVPDYDGEILLTKDIPSLPAGERMEQTPDPDDLFILLYTSGSTGMPKGVMVEHGNMVNFCTWYRDHFQIDEHCRVGGYASYGFDANMMETYPALTSGATLFIVEEEIRLDLLAMEEWYKSRAITHAFMTTQIARQFYTMASIPGLRYLNTGGEKLVPVTPREDGPMLTNCYGPTECTIMTHAMSVDRLYGRVPIGKPLPNLKCYVVDENMHRLPPLVPGELLVAGHSVARGYLNRPDLTEKAFIPNPFHDEPGYDRIYRTGDVVRLLPDGNYDFIGRNDGQVKVRGFRIELSEVESIILEFPGIEDVTVQVFEHEDSGEKYIAAYVVSEKEVDDSALKEFIRSGKPAYMVPSVIMQIEAIPLNQNQKVNKAALPKPEWTQEEVIPPQNEAQQKVFDCLARILGHSQFGIRTDIYEAGLSSIGVLRLNVMLSKAFDIPVSITDLKNHPTVESLEAFLSSRTGGETYDLQEDYPLTQTQDGILVESISHPGSILYNIPELFKISEKVDVNRLKAAVEKAIEAHPYMNMTIFTDDQGNFRAHRNDDLAPVVEMLNMDELPEKLTAPFNLMGERLYRAKIYCTGEGNWLFLELHHILCDGSSMQVLVHDINEAYAGHAVAREKYTGFELALDEEKLRRTDRYDKAKAWFDDLLSEVDKDMLPEGDVWDESVSSGFLTAPSDMDLTGIRQFLNQHDISPNAFFNAVFAFVLARFTGKEEALYTTIYNGRSDSRTARSVTMLVKTFPVFCSLNLEESIRDFTESLGRQIMTSMANDLYSFAEISNEHGIGSDVLFVYQGNEFAFDTIGGEKAEQFALPTGDAKTPLQIEFFEKDDRLVFLCEYRNDRFSENYIRRFIAGMEKAAQEFTKKERLSEIDLVDEKTLVEMDAFNKTDVTYPARDIVSMFREAADRFPDRTALVFKKKELTYHQVDEISDRIAAFLREQGIGRGKVVSILIPRCEYMVIASLGVLKAGAAYQPLDPSYPADRLTFMMKDADCACLIADEGLLDKVPEYTGTVLLTKDIPSLPAAEGMAEHPQPEDLFILLYTSGSTGLPKGVMLEHGNLSNFCAWYHDYYQLDESCRVAAYASFGFDACMMDMYPALTTGACVCIVEEEIRLDLVAMGVWFRRREITHAFMTTQICRQFYLIANIPTLRYLTAGGEELVPLMPRANAPRLINGYGPTECTIFSTVMPVDRHYERIPIGRPLHGCKCYVVDENMHRLPPLMPGELLIAGRGVGRGYLNHPDLTEKAFIRNPFTDDPEYARAYRTGDIVRLLPDGRIDFLGRRDSQVKIRGFRIELSEVEAAVREYPGITDATVQAFENENSGEMFIAAYVVSRSPVEVSSMKDFIRSRKPAYMVPSVVMQIDAIPLNQNQKVSRRALPKPVWQQGESDYRGPVTKLQAKLCDLFADVLGLERIGIDEDFFELGGTSLTVAKVAVRASIEKLPIAFKDVFEYPTVAEMEKYVLSITHPERIPRPEIDKSDHPSLDWNVPANLKGLSRTSLGDVLLPGATGFLGIHVLKTLLDQEDVKVYCLMRGNSLRAERRLKEMLMYYFDDPHEELFGSRIIPVEGDITDRKSIMALKDLPFKAVINCAASVKHFEADDLLERINWHGVENLIDLCLETGCRLTQVSTVSVAGTSVNLEISPEKKMHENELFFGQSLTNKYAYSKFKAEEAVLNAIEHRGLNGRIIRVGNLMSRKSDGEFQINSLTNAFMRSLRAFAVMHKAPVSMMDSMTEFSPIDCTAEAAVALSQVENFTVFHATNSHWVQMGDVIESMNRCNIPVEMVEEEEFEDTFQKMLRDEKLSTLVAPLLTYQASDQNTEEFFIGYDNTFTTKVLYRMRIKWPIINENYLDRMFTALSTLGFFDYEMRL